MAEMNDTLWGSPCDKRIGRKGADLIQTSRKLLPPFPASIIQIAVIAAAYAE
jgi:hypothetical protein